MLLKVAANASTAARRALPDQHRRKQQGRRHKIHGNRLEVELLYMHRAHGAKQQGRCQHHKDQIRQVLAGFGADPASSSANVPKGNQKHHGQEGSDDGVGHFWVSAWPGLSDADRMGHAIVHATGIVLQHRELTLHRERLRSVFDRRPGKHFHHALRSARDAK